MLFTGMKVTHTYGVYTPTPQIGPAKMWPGGAGVVHICPEVSHHE